MPAAARGAATAFAALAMLAIATFPGPVQGLVVNNPPICRAENHPEALKWVTYSKDRQSHKDLFGPTGCSDISNLRGNIWATFICFNAGIGDRERLMPCRVTSGVTTPSGHKGPIAGWLSDYHLKDRNIPARCFFASRPGRDPGPPGGNFYAEEGQFEIIDPTVVAGSMFWADWGGRFPPGSYVAAAKSSDGLDRVICAAKIRGAMQPPNNGADWRWIIGFMDFPAYGKDGDGQGYCRISWNSQAFSVVYDPVLVGPDNVKFLYTDKSKCQDEVPDVTVTSTSVKTTVSVSTSVSTYLAFVTSTSVSTAVVTTRITVPTTLTVPSPTTYYVPVPTTVFSVKTVSSVRTVLKTKTTTKTKTKTVTKRA
ncbi:hypothetical protein DFJ74DRAFT_500558 [Hyaloraphidium curvatum]|nr:hypothetical protein DFJ74DRAFT_500558 [Hyaloraphidium curvatum]